MSGAQRQTTESTVSDQLTDRLQAIVESGLDLNATVWLPESDTAECYHEDCAWGPGCPEHIGKLVESTLRGAVIRGLRPCTQCNPVDYRTAGGASL